MKIQQFEDKGLAQYGYAVLSETTGEVVLIDPARDPQPYYDYAAANNAKIVGVIETHPHADFVSSHLEIHHKTGATIYAHSLIGADYPHEAFDEGAELQLGDIKLKSLHTPGHSPDGISIVLEHEGKDKAVFTGDTLFIGDVGRPDLRESAGNVTAKREELAREMYYSTRNKLMKLEDDVLVYPAHGAGTLCGKGLSEANSSTIGAEKASNYALQQMSEDEFVKVLTEDQPFIPKYFGYDVSLNKKGAPALQPSIEGVVRLEKNFKPEKGAVIVDARSEKVFKKGHYQGAINIQNGNKFETWLGSIMGPNESYYLVGESEEQLNELIAKAARIGYELLIKGVFVYDQQDGEMSDAFDSASFEARKDDFTIVDIRNSSEVKAGKFFEHSINIPLPELRERAGEIPADKPVVVHCAGGYRSAAGSSIVAAALPDVKVLDMSEAVTELKQK
ncbi:glyoxylase-like metal-dependent hydrolase (beta-lactamase superfamily II) [Pontibacter ummariensis]|uniref:Glyoxylase, beta-lactamase superfamily II n=1 Tax=Pontibacter ummariensis TaxID=1610492 RepID=A0A239KTM9_9BACT|nr:rhodanese-like domain-containing protein [Pontibacter ummariensis]PRY05002.1 glyoxylase-like metal-dependent hydrolase (beta-lactamase superfamily II) [Pontibacter ummariensis]SNT20953.1 Glyoxylase, beta-lactamase superfamily II [Pontibacter ummariensis]